MFLDRVHGRTGIRFEVINEAEESRLTSLAVRHALRPHTTFKRTRTLVMEAGGGSTSLTVLRRAKTDPLRRVRARLGGRLPPFTSATGRRHGNVYRGRVTSNVVPDSADEVTPISPPWAMTMARAMNKPKPRLRGLSDVPRLSGWNTVA